MNPKETSVSAQCVFNKIYMPISMQSKFICCFAVILCSLRNVNSSCMTKIYYMRFMSHIDILLVMAPSQTQVYWVLNPIVGQCSLFRVCRFLCGHGCWWYCSCSWVWPSHPSLPLAPSIQCASASSEISSRTPPSTTISTMLYKSVVSESLSTDFLVNYQLLFRVFI